MCQLRNKENIHQFKTFLLIMLMTDLATKACKFMISEKKIIFIAKIKEINPDFSPYATEIFQN